MLRLAGKLVALGPAGWVDLAMLSALGVVIEVGLRTRPLPKVANLLGVRLSGETGPASGRPLTAAERRRRRVVEMMSRHWPFVDHDGLCLRRSLLFAWVFRARDPVVRIGVSKMGCAVTAHAWLELEGSHIGADGRHVALPIPAAPQRPRRRPRKR